MSATASAPQIHNRVQEFVGTPRKMFINGKWVEAASGKTFPVLQSRHRRSAGPGRRRRSRRHRSRREGRAQGIRKRPVAGHERVRSAAA